MMALIDKDKFKKIMIYTFIFGFIAHGYMYMNGDYTHDSLYGIVGITPIDEMNLSIGRFLIPLYLKVRGYVASPLLIGVLITLFVGISSYIIIDLLEIKNELLKICVSAILITNYTITVTNATYLNDSDPYCLSLLFAVLSIFCFKKLKKYWKLLGIPCLVMCIGLYQAYFQVALFLLMIIAIKELLTQTNTKEIVKDNLITLVYMFIGVVIYYIIYKLVLKVTGYDAGNLYNAIPDLSFYLDFERIISFFKYMILKEREWFVGKNNHHRRLILVINLIFVALSVYSIAFVAIKNKISKGRKALIIVILLLMPLGMNVIGLLCDMYEHEVMTYSFFLAYALVVMVFEIYQENKGDKKVQKIIGSLSHKGICLCFSILVLSNCIYSNEMYYEKHLVVQSTDMLMTRVIDRMEQMDGYELGVTPVVFIGQPSQSGYNYYRSGFLNTAEGTNVYTSISYYQTYESYFKEYLGYPINLLDIGVSCDMGEIEEIIEMPCFPAKGSVAYYNDILVVKIA